MLTGNGFATGRHAASGGSDETATAAPGGTGKTPGLPLPGFGRCGRGLLGLAAALLGAALSRATGPTRCAAALLLVLAALFAAATDARAQTVETLVSNVGQAADTGGIADVNTVQAQQFTTGDHARGYVLSEVQGRITDYGGSDMVSVTIWSDDGSGNPHARLFTLTNPSSITNNAFNTFTAPVDSILLANTPYHVVFEATSGIFTIGDTRSSAEDAGGATGWSIANFRSFSTSGGSIWASATDTAILIAIRGSEVSVTNTAPTVAAPLADQSARAGTAFRYQFPANSFTDSDIGDTLTYSATQSDGSALPSWLAFDAATRTFSGTPRSAGTVSVEVTAEDSGRETVSDEFDITVALLSAATLPTPRNSGAAT